MYGSGCHILGDSFVKIAVAFLKKKKVLYKKLLYMEKSLLNIYITI